MPDEHSEIQALNARIAALERQQSRSKILRLAPWLLIPALLAAGQTTPAARSIEATEVTIKDRTGTVRAKLSAEGLELSNAEGIPRCALHSIGMLMLFGDRKGKSGDAVLTSEILRFYGSNPNTPVSQFSTDDLVLHIQPGTGKALVGLRADDKTGTISVSDINGFSALLGQAPLENLTAGGTRTTSAASLVLLVKEDHVIWKAP